MSQQRHLTAILAGIQEAVEGIGKKTGALLLVNLQGVRNPDNNGHRITLIVDMPDAFVDGVAGERD